MTSTLPFPNLSSMHRATAQRLGPRTALRYRRRGLFHDLSWSDYRDRADCAAGGLLALGIGPGDRVAILSENRFEWLIADHAILSARAINVPLHAPLAPKQVEYQLGHSGAKALFVSNQAQADKVMQVLASLPELKSLICFEPIQPGPLELLTWQGLVHRGVGRRDRVAEIESGLRPDNLATIIYTSGTTGNPKGVMLTHGNLLSNAVASHQRLGSHETDTLLSWLPYSHIYARTVDHYTTTLAGITVALGGPVERLLEDLRDIEPTWMTAVPRFYEKVWAIVQGLSTEDRRRKLREIFPRIKHLSSGGAPLPTHIAQGFHDAGIELYEGYGLTESSPVITFNGRGRNRVGSVGTPIPGVEVRIADDGEILTRGPHVMQGYWKNPQATGEAIEDGWLHTGDVGRIDGDGFLFITDRKKDLIVTSGGKNIAPAELERLLLTEPCIDQAVVYGDARPFVSALIVPNFQQLQKETGFQPRDNGDWIDDPQVRDFYEQRLAKLMNALSQPERVKKFLLLSRPFRLDADELTATLKVRRRHIISKYEAQLAALYA